MKCQYCNSILFTTDRSCPQCGGPIQEMARNLNVEKIKDISDPSVKVEWYGHDDSKTMWGTTPNILFALLGVLFFIPVPGLFCFAMAGEQTFFLPMTLLVIVFLFASLGHPKI